MTPPSARSATDHEPDADEQETSPSPNAPAPNGIEGRYRTAGMRTAAITAGSSWSPTSGFWPLAA